MAASAVVVATATSTVTARPVPEKLDQASYSSCQIVLQFVQLRLRLLPLTAELPQVSLMQMASLHILMVR